MTTGIRRGNTTNNDEIADAARYPADISPRVGTPMMNPDPQMRLQRKAPIASTHSLTQQRAADNALL